MTVDAQQGQGSSFSVFLPGSGPEAPRTGSAGTPARADAAPGGREVILLVEDEASVRRIASRVLRSLGYDVVEAASGTEALAVERADIDLLVTDLVMPGVSGRELADRLRQRRPDLRILFMSGYSADMLRSDPARTGAHFLQKPFSRESLAKAVRDALDSGPGAAQPT